MIGSENFIMGFQLVGVKNAQISDEEPFQKMKMIMEDNKTSIVIVDEGTMKKLNKYEQEEIENSAYPVFLTLSKQADDERMRKMIIEAIGVDVWNKN